MKLLTANRLGDGVIVWYSDVSGSWCWVEDGALATRLEDDAADALQKEWAARETELVGVYLIPLTADGQPVQREHVREFVRANGPTIGQTAFDTSKSLHRPEIFE